MAELPLLFLPQPTTAKRQTLGGRGPSYAKPSAQQQRERLDARFRQIADSFHAIQTSVQGLEPEQVLVLETIGETVDRLARACEQISGLEWLAELDAEDVEPIGGFEKEGDELLPCRLYAVMTNQQSMDRLIGLWDDWCSDPDKQAQRNFGPFKNLFKNLREIRRWNAEDRIHATGVLEYLTERLDEGAGELRFEIELWCRQSTQARTQAFETLSNLVTAQGGACITQAMVPEIFYHGVLVKMPASAVRETVNGILNQEYGPLVRCEDVMFFRPFAQAGFQSEESDSQDQVKTPLSEKPLPAGDPVIAILDGLPLEHHDALDGRLIIDDADEHASQYSPGDQQHGTAMASLVLHGDLNREDEQPLRTPVYVRPILVPKRDFQNQVYEVVPDDELLVDVIHRTVRSMFDGESPTAPTVKLINLSVANSYQPFDRELSPLGRLLDWLSWKYKVLFLVSVGNHPQDIVLDLSCAEWEKLSDDERCRQTIEAIHYEQLNRRPYSPAEAINPLTVGALHADDSNPPAYGRRVDILSGNVFPSPIGTVSSGHRRSIKPEVYFPAGRQLYYEPIGASDAKATFTIAQGFIPPGQQVAAPGQAPLELTRTVHSRGTSNATALASRLGGKLHERLAELRDEPGGDRLDEAEEAVLLKCMLVHGAAWGDGSDLLRGVFQEDIYDRFDSNRAWREMDRILCRFLGYGAVSSDVAMFSTDERVTVIGWSNIQNDQGHLFKLPLPSALSGSRVKRRLTGTLAWLTPTNPQHRNYREAALWFSLNESQLGVKRAQVDSDTARRGTVEHRILEGEKVVAFDDEEDLEIAVSCKSDAGVLKATIPYALAVTLEVSEPLGVSIFEQVRDRIRPRIEIEPDG